MNTNNPVHFDHIEVHVKDIKGYCQFLRKLFPSGKSKVISESGTSMFKTSDGLNIEIKKRTVASQPVAAGFCNPCFRRKGAKDFIEDELKLKIQKIIKNPDGDCCFFADHEGVLWHIKDYLVEDVYINW